MKFYIFGLFVLMIHSNAFILKNKHFSYLSNAKKKYVNEEFDWDYEESKIETTTSKNFKELFKARTLKQKQYYADIYNEDLKLVIVSGPAGTGKTLFPTQYAAKLLKETKQKIILTRPLISVDEELGYLPGDINQKMDPWVIPIFDILRDYFSQKELNVFMEEKRIEIVPLAFMRGRTFKNALIIGDELQNTSNNQLLMLLTRIGDNSKMILTGDIEQCDNKENGLMILLSKIDIKYENKEELRDKKISIVEFSHNDIQRSPIIETILSIYKE